MKRLGSRERQNRFLRIVLQATIPFSGTYIAESPHAGDGRRAGLDSNLNGDSAGDRVIVNPAGDANIGSGVTPLTNSAGAAVAYRCGTIRMPATFWRSRERTPMADAQTLPLRGINNFDLSFSNAIPYHGAQADRISRRNV